MKRELENFAPMVHGILLSRVPRQDVEDLVQDVLVSALEKAELLRDPAALGPWLATVARNRAVDYHRRKKPSTELDEDTVANEPLPRSEAEEVLVAIRSLPAAYRETLVLRLVEGLTGPEIAEQTGLSPDSVRVNLHRGMKLLRDKLEGRGEP